MIDKHVCPNCGQLYDNELTECPLCGAPAQVVEAEAAAPRKRITEAERKQRRDDRREAEQEAKRRRKDEQLIQDAEEERQIEEEAQRRKEEKRRAREEKKASRKPVSPEPAPAPKDVPAPTPTPVMTPAPARTKQRPPVYEKDALQDRTRVPRFFLVLSTILLVAALAVGGSYLLWKLDVVDIPVYDRLLEKKEAEEAARNETQPFGTADPSDTAETEAPVDTTEAQAVTPDTPKPCTSLTLEQSELTITQAGDMIQIAAAALPADTTDEKVFTSSDEKVAKVSPVGIVTAVAPGEAVITVTCGSKTAECRVSCEFDPTTESSEVQVDVDELILLKDDMTFFNEGENYFLTVTNIPAGTPVTWTSEDESIATVDASGHVVAVGNGTTNVVATVGGLTAKCIVRCHFSEN